MTPKKLFARKVLYILWIIAGYIFIVIGSMTEMDHTFLGLKLMLNLLLGVITVAGIWAVYYVIKSEKL